MLLKQYFNILYPVHTKNKTTLKHSLFNEVLNIPAHTKNEPGLN